MCLIHIRLGSLKRCNGEVRTDRLYGEQHSHPCGTASLIRNAQMQPLHPSPHTLVALSSQSFVALNSQRWYMPATGPHRAISHA